MSNTYALYVAPDAPDMVLASIGVFLKTDERIGSWWNHVPFLYMMTSECDAATLSKSIAKLVKPWTFLVIKVDPEDSQGWMPERAWDWILRRQVAGEHSVKLTKQHMQEASS